MPVPTAISHYTIEGELGRGAMGVVYLARDGRLDRLVAIKALPESLVADGAWRARMEREARILASMNHPNIAAIYGLEELDGAAYLVLELADGPTLAEVLREVRGEAQTAGVDMDAALRLCAQIASGVGAAHERGVIHRDLKPANIKVRPDGLVKVLDFGIAKRGLVVGLSDAETLAASERPVSSFGAAMVGTPGYFSPEQARGKPVSRATDLWAFGCVLFECLTGQKACPGETLADIVVSTLVSEPEYDALPRRTPGTVRTLLRRCLAKDHSERLADFAEARACLERALEELAGHVAVSAGAGAGVDPAPSNLPEEQVRVLSRTSAVQQVGAALETERVATLVGPPGVGKSRIALRAAHGQSSGGDGHGRAWWIDVPEDADAAFLARFGAVITGARADGAGDALPAMARLLGDSPALLVLDGCDGARRACAEFAALATGACTGLRLLATSRFPLGVVGEAVVPIAGLEAPAPHATQGRFVAAALFVERAARAGFKADSDNAPHVASLCRRVLGLPLAVEILAARAGGQFFERILPRFVQRLELGLNSGVGSLEERLLRAVADWAIEQVPHTQLELLRRVAVMSGWFDLRAAAAVTVDQASHSRAVQATVAGPYAQEEWDTLRLLKGLADRALLAARAEGEGAAQRHWFRVHGAVREAALGNLKLHEGAAGPALALARYAGDLTQHAAERFGEADGALWVRAVRDRIGVLHDGLRLSAEHGAAGEEQQIREGLERFWTVHGV